MPAAALIGGFGLLGSGLSANAANNAASTQANAANQAAQLQYQLGQQNLDFQKYIFGIQQQNMAPWLAAGKQGLSTLSGLLSTPGQGLLAPYGQQFSAPTMAEAQGDPGYQFGLDQGLSAIQRGAAARGGLLSGGTEKALNRYGTDYATTKYNDVFNRKLNTYQTNYNVWANDTNNEFNRLGALSGVGQTAANTLNMNAGQLGANVGNTYNYMGNAMANGINNAAAARASGYVGSANAWNSGLSGFGNNLLSMYLMQNMYGNNSSLNPGGMYNGGGYG